MPALPTCRCGHDREHRMVTAESEHGFLGYLRLMIGGTPMPRRIVFRCRVCHMAFDASEDPNVRRKHV